MRFDRGPRERRARLARLVPDRPVFATLMAQDHHKLDDAFFGGLREQFTDPEIIVRPARHQVDDLLEEIRKRVALHERPVFPEVIA